MLTNFHKRKKINDSFLCSMNNLESMCFNLDSQRFIASSIFFLCYILNDIEEQYICPIIFVIDNSINSKGVVFPGSDFKEIYIYISDKNIKNEVDNNLGPGNYLHGFFISILHEFAHLKYILTSLQERKENNLKKLFVERYQQKKLFLKELSNFDNCKEYNNILFSDEEFYAETFSYKNLDFFKNLYNSKGYFTSTMFYMLDE